MSGPAPAAEESTGWKNGVWVLLNNIEGPVNLGFISRAMANTGFAQLRFCGPVSADDPDVLRYAVHSGHLRENFTRVEDIGGLCRAMDVVIGMSPRQPWSDGCDITLDQLPALVGQYAAAHKRVGLLFGNEAHGLDNAALSHCRYRLALPTDSGYTSMNLAQAVLIVLWELHRHGASGVGIDPSMPAAAPASMREQFLEKLHQYLELIDYLDPQNPDHLWQELAIMIRKRDWSERELTLLMGLIHTSRKRLLSAGHKTTTENSRHPAP